MTLLVDTHYKSRVDEAGLNECVILKLSYNDIIVFPSLYSMSLDLLRTYYVLRVRDPVVTL